MLNSFGQFRVGVASQNNHYISDMIINPQVNAGIDSEKQALLLLRTVVVFRPNKFEIILFAFKIIECCASF